MPLLSGAGGVLRHRDYRVLFAGQAVSVVGDALFPVALAFAVIDELDGTPTQLGVVLAAQVVPMTFLVLAAGVWADRVSRRRLMLLSDVGRGAVQAAVAVLLLSGRAELWQLVALVALYGCFEALFRPAAGGLVPALVPPGELQQANALIGLAQNAGTVIGPGIAAALIVALSPGAAVAVDAASFAVSAAFLVLLREPARPRPPDGGHARGFLHELRGGLAEVRSRRWMLAFMPPFSAYHWIALPCVLALGPVLAARELDGAASWAAITTAFGLGTIAGSTVALRWKPPRPMLAATLAFILCAAQPAIIALAGSTAAIAAAEAVAGVAVAVGFAQWETSIGRFVPGTALSRVTSLDWFVTVGLMPVGYALCGPVADAVGLHATMVAASVLVAAVFAAALAVPDVRDLRQESVAS